MIRRINLFVCNLSFEVKAMLLAGIFAGTLLASPLNAQSNAQTSPKVTKASAPSAPTRYRPNRFPKKEAAYFGLFWGIDSLNVKAVESGELIRFSYRVLDADKAKAINNKKIDAYLIAPDSHLRLSVPSIEKVGQLRQSNTPEDGKSYWMAFSNPGRRVRPGDHVNVVIGQFVAEGLVVE